MVTDIKLLDDDVKEMHRQIFDYAATLTFWRTLEEKYRERRRQWLAAMAAPKMTRPFRRDSAILKTTVHLDDDLKTPDNSASNLSEECMDVVTDREFSDVDSDLFTDPGDVRHRLSHF